MRLRLFQLLRAACQHQQLQHVVLGLEPEAATTTASGARLANGVRRCVTQVRIYLRIWWFYDSSSVRRRAVVRLAAEVVASAVRPAPCYVSLDRPNLPCYVYHEPCAHWYCCFVASTFVVSQKQQKLKVY
jgi:hypothetical protein